MSEEVFTVERPQVQAASLSIDEWEEIADGLNNSYESCIRSARTTLRRAIGLGCDLEGAKANIGHGKWGDFVRGYCDFTQRTAELYMQLWKNRKILEEADDENSKDISNFTLTGAITYIRMKKAKTYSKGNHREANLQIQLEAFAKRLTSIKEKNSRMIEQLEGYDDGIWNSDEARVVIDAATGVIGQLQKITPN